MKRRQFLASSGLCAGWILIPDAFRKSLPADSGIFPPDDKYSCEALYYKALPHGIQCTLCPNNCNINEIRPGNCHTRIIHNGKLYSIAFGNPYYINIVRVETESLFHFSPGDKMLALGTGGCNLTCLYCRVYPVSQKSPEENSFTALSPGEAIQYCKKKGLKAIAYTYTEPIAFYEYMLQTAKLAHRNGIKNVMISNGYINEAPLEALIPFLDAAVIDVKAFSESSYQKLAGGSIFPVFKTLKMLKAKKIWTEITHLLVPGWTDNFGLIEKMSHWMKENDLTETPIHFQKFEPAFQLKSLSPTSEEALERAHSIATTAGLAFVYTSSNHINTTCPGCHKIVVERNNSLGVVNHLKNGACPYCHLSIAGCW